MEDLVNRLRRLGPVRLASVDEKDAREVERPALLNLVYLILCVAAHREFLLAALELFAQVERGSEVALDLANVEENV